MLDSGDSQIVFEIVDDSAFSAVQSHAGDMLRYLATGGYKVLEGMLDIKRYLVIYDYDVELAIKYLASRSELLLHEQDPSDELKSAAAHLMHLSRRLNNEYAFLRACEILGGEEKAFAWFHEACSEFDGLTPYQVLLSPDRRKGPDVIEYLESLEAGS